MNFLKRISFFSFIPIIVFSSINSYSQSLNDINITFKDVTDQKYIELVSLFTNTNIKEKVSDNKYILSTTNNNIDYKNLLSMVKGIEYIDQAHISVKSDLKNKKIGNYVDGIILVKYKPEIKLALINKIDKKYKTKSVLFSKSLGLYKVELPKTLSVEQAVKIFSNLPEVQYAEPDMIMSIMKTSANNHFNFSFKDQLSQKVFENIFDLDCKGSFDNCIVSLSDEFNSQNVISSFKLSPYILNIKQVK